MKNAGALSGWRRSRSKPPTTLCGLLPSVMLTWLRVSAVVLLCSVTASAVAADAAVSTTPVTLHPEQITNLKLGWGVITSIRIDTKRPLERIILGENIAEVRHDESLGRIDLKPVVQSGATNMIVTIGGVDYVFVLEVTPDYREVAYTRTYVLQSQALDTVVADLSRVAAAPNLKPTQLDVVALTKAVTRARIDPVYAQTIPDLRIADIRKPYTWNGCIVYLMDVAAFLDRDILLFRIEWMNTSDRGIYLNPRQLGIKAAATSFRTKASHQLSPDGWVMPGQRDVLWLVVQGTRAAYVNEWTLTFPPDAAVLRQVVK